MFSTSTLQTIARALLPLSLTTPLAAFAVAGDVGTALKQAASAPPSVGQTAPDFEIKLADGKTTTLQKLATEHKFVVLEWYNQDCPYVRKHYDTGNMQELQTKYRKQDVAWLTIVSSAEGKQGHLSLEEAKKQKTSGEKDFSSTALLIDANGNVGRSFGAKTTPHMYIVNPGMKLIYAGAIDGVPTADKADVKTDKKWFDAALSKVIAGKELSAEESITKPYGCSVKY